jgi:hypothetical protein
MDACRRRSLTDAQRTFRYPIGEPPIFLQSAHRKTEITIENRCVGKAPTSVFHAEAEAAQCSARRDAKLGELLVADADSEGAIRWLIAVMVLCYALQRRSYVSQTSVYPA